MKETQILSELKNSLFKCVEKYSSVRTGRKIYVMDDLANSICSIFRTTAMTLFLCRAPKLMLDWERRYCKIQVKHRYLKVVNDTKLDKTGKSWRD